MAKAKLYGGRWRTTDTLGQGGQGVVYRAVDESGEHAGEYALKRVLSTLRDDRFITEVQASLRLTHDNILPVIDHSLLSDGEAKKYLVTPLALGRDLSKRAGLYAGVLDSTIIVARGLCRALDQAHAGSVIHRDVKPENILFRSENTHEPWLADFGICFFSDGAARSTQVNERVGPPYFVAPELEAGGILDVSPAADVYSLGKVIYYMISGGDVMARESLFATDTSSWDTKGPRHQLLKLLLAKMICPLPNRLRAIRDVDQELLRIESWDEKVAGAPLSSTSLSMVASLRERSLLTQEVRARNQAARKRELDHVDAVAKQFVEWVDQRLAAVRMELEDPDHLEVAVRDLVRPPGSRITSLGDQNYRIVAGRQISLTVPNIPFRTEHVLGFALCSLVVLSPHADGNHEVPERDIPLIAYPYHIAVRQGARPPPGVSKPLKAGFAVGEGRQRSVLEARFKTSEWPAVVDQLTPLLSQALERTIKIVQGQAVFR